MSPLILIADDEAPARARLRGLIEELELGTVVGEAANGREALDLVGRHQPHVLLLDIRMPGMDGLEVATHLTGLDTAPAVIFTTAYDAYALQAFQARAVGYLLKPVRREKLAEALAGARRLNRVQLEALHRHNKPRPVRSHISANCQGELHLVPIADVRYFHAEHKYVTVGHPGGTLLIEESLKALEQEFADAFIRVHRNALVARAHLYALERGPGGQPRIRLHDVAETFEVSRRHLPRLRQYMRN